jgi:hypothetical protein
MTVRVLLAKFGRSRMRLAVIDFGDVVIFADEFGNVGKMTKDKVEVPGRWEEVAYDAYSWLYTPREEARTSPTWGALKRRYAKKTCFRSKDSCWRTTVPSSATS